MPGRPVVLDAAGTLILLREPVGAAYARIARDAGGAFEPAAVEAGFGQAFAAAPPLAFGHLPPVERRVAERAWWRVVARGALEAAAPWPAGFSFDRFFDLAWQRFADPAAWVVPADVRPALRSLRRAGVPLAVLSNWDGRLPRLLDGLGLGGFFARVVVSGELPAAKPDPAAFAAARRAIGLGVAPPLMVGDRPEHDVAPARAAGWDALWLDRDGGAGEWVAPAEAVTDLRALIGHPLVTAAA